MQQFGRGKIEQQVGSLLGVSFKATFVNNWRVPDAQGTSSEKLSVIVQKILNNIRGIVAAGGRDLETAVPLLLLGSQFERLPITKPGFISRIIRGGICNVTNPEFSEIALTRLWNGIKQAGFEPRIRAQIVRSPMDPPGYWKEYLIVIARRSEGHF